MTGSIFDLNSEQPANQYSIVEDDELIASLREGCEHGYETLLARFQQPVYNLAFRLLNDPAVGGLSIDVDTYKGAVTLSGRVKSQAEHDQAVALARKVDGVTEVKDALQVIP